MLSSEAPHRLIVLPSVAREIVAEHVSHDLGARQEAEVHPGAEPAADARGADILRRRGRNRR